LKTTIGDTKVLLDNFIQKKKKKKKKKKIYSPKRLVARKGFSPSTLATVNTNITC